MWGTLPIMPYAVVKVARCAIALHYRNRLNCSSISIGSLHMMEFSLTLVVNIFEQLVMTIVNITAFLGSGV